MKAARAITCPACGGTVEIRAAGFSVNLTCLHCGALLDVSRPDVALIREARLAATRFTLPLGARGRVFDDEWEVVGALERSDAESLWQEFLLFNPYLGYRWLVEYDGEWQFGAAVVDRPTGDPERVIWRGEGYTLTGPEQTATVMTVIGEFYWRVATGDRAQCSLYGRGDAVLSRDLSDGEENWTQLVPLDPRDVAAAFGQPLPDSGRPGPRQGFLGGNPDAPPPPDDLPWLCLVAIIVAILGLLTTTLFDGPASATSGAASATIGQRSPPVLVGSIVVSRPYQFVTFTASASQLSNSWVDLDFSLVNRATQQSIDAYGLVERYTGTDSEGPWTEDGSYHTTTIGHVPSGTYDVYVEAEAHGWPIDPLPPVDGWSQPASIPLAIAATTGAAPSGMLWTLMFAVFALPGMILWWRLENKSDD